MASKMQSLILILLSLLITFSSTIVSSQQSKGGIAVYWGQNNGDKTLTETCDSNHYEIVLLAFLVQFGCNREVQWNFAGHCGDWNPCSTVLPSQIKYCQDKGVKVLLSLGGADVAAYDYGLCSAQDAKNFAKYLYDNFLSGQFGPLGSVTLNGIDFDIEKTDQYWDVLARELDALRQPNNKFYLSAAPQCPTEPKVYYLGEAIKTGLFDYVFVQFYNNPVCSYSASTGTKPVLDSWDKWVSLVLPNNSLFLGLPAGPDAAGYGYMTPEVVINEVLPHIKQASNYGGVMLWDRYRDVLYDFSGKILPYVSKNVLLRSATAVMDAIIDCVSAALNSILPKAQ